MLSSCGLLEPALFFHVVTLILLIQFFLHCFCLLEWGANDYYSMTEEELFFLNECECEVFSLYIFLKNSYFNFIFCSLGCPL